MSTNQTVYADTLAPAYPGMIRNGETSNRFSRTCEDSAGLGFGRAVYQGAGDHGCTGTQTLTGAGSAAAGNVGTSTITASPTVGLGARIGRYRILQLDTSATGALAVYDPVGILVAHGVVGTAITTIPGITSVTVTGAGTPTKGDTFYIDVTGNAFLGISIAHEALAGILPGQTVDKYQQYDNVAILSRGEIAVTASSSCTPRASAFADGNGDFATSGAPSGGFEFDITGSSSDVVWLAKR